MGVFGWVMPTPLDYLGFVGLWLHMDRVCLRRALATARAMGLVLGNQVEVDRAYFDAEARCEAEIDDMAFSANTARSRQRDLAKLGMT